MSCNNPSRVRDLERRLAEAGTQRDRLRSALQRLVDSVVDVDFVDDDGEVNAVLSVHPDAVEIARAALSDPTQEKP